MTVELRRSVINGNEDYLRQLFFILLDNAFKFTPEAGVVEVHGAAFGDVVRIGVIDTGRGIAPGDLPYIFDRFYRGKKSGSGESMSLGLSIARHIAQQHGGKSKSSLKSGKAVVSPSPCR
jgi:two-component system OmpR family sensor kinase